MQMKLLIITQKVDRKDPILGFFHRWIELFASECDTVIVMGQTVGAHALPENVHVHSLGKERGLSKVAQVLRFWRNQFLLLKHHDAVLVHMTPVWVLLGFPLWFACRKPVYLWYEARGGGRVLPLAIKCVRASFGATAFGMPLGNAKHMVLGHGIDTDLFVPPIIARDERLILTIGRITSVKHIDVIYRAFAALPSEYRLRVVGGPITPADVIEQENLRQLAEELSIRDRVESGFCEHAEIPDLLRKAALFAHACSGGLDKVLLEAMACGCPILTSSRAAIGVLPQECLCEERDFSRRLGEMIARDDSQKAALCASLRQSAVEHHDLRSLIRRMVAIMDHK